MVRSMTFAINESLGTQFVLQYIVCKIDQRTPSNYAQHSGHVSWRRLAGDTDNTLRPTIIKVGETWGKRSQGGLLSAPKTTDLMGDEQRVRPIDGNGGPQRRVRGFLGGSSNGPPSVSALLRPSGGASAGTGPLGGALPLRDVALPRRPAPTTGQLLDFRTNPTVLQREPRTPRSP